MEKYYNNNKLNELADELLRQVGINREVPWQVVSEEKILMCKDRQERMLEKITSGPLKGKFREILGTICPVSGKRCVNNARCGRLQSYRDVINSGRNTR